MNKFVNKIKTMFGYNIITDVGKRKASTGIIKNEDYELQPYAKRKVISSAQDQMRNFAIAGWMIRKHLDYVSRFYFHANNDNDKLNDKLESLFDNWSMKHNCDITRRNNFRAMLRLFEIHKILDGDAGLIKISNGSLQGIEGSRIARPTMGVIPKKYEKKVTPHGLILDKFGAVEQYIINTRDTGSTLKFANAVSYKDMLFDGYFARFDQTRGVSPFVSALTSLMDCQEGIDHQLVKAKMHAMFGIAIMSDANSSGGDGFEYKDGGSNNTPDSNTTDYEFSLKAGLKLGLKPGHKIDTIESRTPSTEFQDFTQLIIAIALKSLDIPTTFWDSSQSSYSAMKQDRAEYELSAKSKRERNYEICMEIAEWKIKEWLKNGEFTEFGIKNISDIKYNFISEGVPWLDEQSEVQAAMLRIATGLSSRTIEAKAHNLTFRNVLKDLAKEEQMAIDMGVTLAIGQPGQQTTRDEEGVKNKANETAGERINKDNIKNDKTKSK